MLIKVLTLAVECSNVLQVMLGKLSSLSKSFKWNGVIERLDRRDVVDRKCIRIVVHD